MIDKPEGGWTSAIPDWKSSKGFNYKYTYRECSRGERTAEREYSRDYKHQK